MRSCAQGPALNLRPGQVGEVNAALGAALVAAGFAVCLDAPVVEDAPETALAEPAAETAVKRAPRRRRK